MASNTIMNRDGTYPLVWRGRLDAWLQLVRAPNLLTVPGDPLAGFLLGSVAGGYASLGAVFPCVAASLCLYCAGLLANDYFDLEEDKRERPSRPLPSGRVGPRSALAAALSMAVLGVAASSVAGMAAALIALLLVLAIALYDTRGKRLAGWGPLNMGICRGLSLLLGAAAAGSSSICSAPVLIGACGLTLYIAGVTGIAAKETQVSDVGLKSFLPMAVLAVWFMTLYGVARPTDPLAGIPFAVLAFAVLLWAAHCTRMLKGETSPSIKSQAVGGLLRGLLLMQAALCALVVNPGLLVATVVLLGWPISSRLARRFYAS